MAEPFEDYGFRVQFMRAPTLVTAAQRAQIPTTFATPAAMNAPPVKHAKAMCAGSQLGTIDTVRSR